MTPGSVISIVLVVYSIILHEIAHGWAAYKLGDPTAARLNRLSLNPLVHIDPVMTVMVPLICYISSGGTFIFGGAKPVPVNPLTFRRPRQDMAKVAFAGPFINLAISALFLILLCFPVMTPAASFNYDIFLRVAGLNYILALFNMIPIPPLDGSKVMMGILPRRYAYIFDVPFFVGMILVVGFAVYLWPLVGGYLMMPFAKVVEYVWRIRVMLSPVS